MVLRIVGGKREPGPAGAPDSGEAGVQARITNARRSRTHSSMAASCAAWGLAVTLQPPTTRTSELWRTRSSRMAGLGEEARSHSPHSMSACSIVTSAEKSTTRSTMLRCHCTDVQRRDRRHAIFGRPFAPRRDRRSSRISTKPSSDGNRNRVID